MPNPKPKTPAKAKTPSAIVTVAEVPAVPEQPIIYDSIQMFCAYGDDAITFDEVEKMLGLEKVGKDDPRAVPEIVTLTTKGVVCHNNTRNRYLTLSHLEHLRQEHLNRRWRRNGSIIVIGDRGQVLSGQHRLYSFWAAVLIWRDKDHPQYHHWREVWPEEPRFETLLVYGIPEDDEVFATLNQEKPGSQSEVLYRSSYFANDTPGDRKTLARMTDYAVKLLWERTGAKADPYAPHRSTGETLDFLKRHPTVVAAVRHVAGENKPRMVKSKDPDTGEEVTKKLPGPVSELIPPGTAAGLMYLMAASGTKEPGDYTNADPHPHEGALDLGRWDKAMEFWVHAGGSVKLQRYRDAVFALQGEDGAGGGTVAEKTALTVLAWNQYVQGHTVTDDDLKLEYHTSAETGYRTLVTRPVLEGIDAGPTKGREPPAGTDEGANGTDAGPSAEALELERRLKELRKGRKATEGLTAAGRAAAEAQGIHIPLPDEVRPGPRPVADKDGKPPAPKLAPRPINKRDDPAPAATEPLTAPAPTPKPKRQTRKEVEAAQTEKARQADAELAANGNGAPPAKTKPNPKPRARKPAAE